jgi:molybdopterin/thiamine biosynthesis adenylyltransferase
MAFQARLTAGAQPGAIVRATGSNLLELRTVLFRRYPEWEWATFAQFGWRETPAGLVVTLVRLLVAGTDDLDETVGHVAIQESYSLRVALAAEASPLAVGVIHSHPDGALTLPSVIDDGMDRYYASYFADFAPDRPYISLIFAERSGALFGSGRVHWRGHWHSVDRFLVDGSHIDVDRDRETPRPKVAGVERFKRVARLASAFGEEAAERLKQSCVGVVGVGGTGSPAIEVLARAGVGHLIAVDPDRFADSNLERVHGSTAQDVLDRPSKVAIAKRHVASINPDARLTLIRGRLPQSDVVDALLQADVVLGCTDQQHSRVALSDLAVRYLVPVIDSGVALEGEEGRITGQIVQLLRHLPNDPCVLCREMVSSLRVSQELMSAEERAQRMAAAAAAEARGERPEAYWHREAQLNTVGYLTTTAGALAAGYAIGWLTGRFEPPFARLQMNLSAPFFDVTDIDYPARTSCFCQRVRGWSDQGASDALITAPKHWMPAVFE